MMKKLLSTLFVCLAFSLSMLLPQWAWGRTQDYCPPTILPDTDTTTFCSGSSVQLSIQDAQNYTDITWTLPDNSTAIGSPITASVGGTYTVTVTGVAGCTGTASIEVQENTSPLPTISGNLVICNQTPVTLSVGQYEAYSWSNDDTTQSITVSTADTYSVTVTDENECTGTAQPVVVSESTVQATITSPTTTVLTCATTSIQLQATGGGTGAIYVWNDSGLPSATTAATAPATYTVIVTNNLDCSATDSIVITQDLTPPSAAITTNPTNTTEITCNTSSILLTASGGGTYNWGSGITTATRNVTAAGTYTVTVTGSNGCTSTASITITVNNTPPTAGITTNTGTTQLNCATTSLTLTASGGNTYNWGSGITGATRLATAAGTYTVTVTGANGCSSTASINITGSTTPPTAGITNNTGTTLLSCATPAISLTATGGGTYNWSTGANTANISVTTSGTYSVTVTGGNGCSATADIVITTDGSSIAANITTTPPNTTELTCSTNSIILTASGGNTYNWGGGITTASRPVNAAGTYTVTVTGVNGCTGTASITITANTTPPTAGITNNTGATTLTCATTGINLTATGGGSYNWGGGITAANRTVTTPGTYTVTVTNSGNGCTGTASINITQDITPPTAGITNNTGATQLTCITSAISLTATGGGNYNWSNGANTANISVSTAGTYSVTVTGGNGCSASTSIVITSDNTSVAASITTNPTNTTELTCNTTSITLTASGGGTYNWGGGITTATRTVTTAGTYTVTVTGTNGCSGTASINITANNTPPNAIINNSTGSTVISCNTTFINLTATGGSTYLWNDGVNTAVRIINAPGTYIVTVTGANGCTASASTTITSDGSAVNAAISNPSGNTILTCATTSITVTATGGVSYSWNGGTTTANRTITIPGTYTVTVTGANGCSGSASITITEDKTPPNAGIINSTGTTTLTCTTTSINLTATGGISYNWGGGNTSADRTVTTPGTYTVIVTGANGCTATASTAITANTTPPTPGITNNTGTTLLTCATNSISVTATGGSAYAWNDGITAPTRNFTSPGTYTVTVTNGGNGCTASANITITSDGSAVNANIVNDTGTTILTCTTTSISLTATGGISYNWGGGITTDNRTVTAPGTYTVTVTAANGCTATAVIAITQNTTPPPAAITTNPGTQIITCTTPTLTLTATGGTSYNWGTGPTTNPDRVVSAAGTYTVTVTGANGCTASASIVITINNTPPTAGITNNTGATTLTCTTIGINVTATGGVSYNWGGGITTATRTIIVAGLYTVTVTGSNGCTSTASITITANTTPPTAGITNNTGTTILTCAIDSISLTATGGGTYNWGGGITTANRIVTAPGTYTVTVTGVNGCTATANITITNNDSVIAAISNNTGSTVLACDTASISLTATGGVSYEWSNNDTTANITVIAPGTYTVTVTGANGCTKTASTIITLNKSIPFNNIAIDTTSTFINATIILSAQNNNAYSYLWSNNLTESTITVNLFNNSTTPTYTVTITDTENGCTSTASVDISNCPTPSIYEHRAPSATLPAVLVCTIADANAYQWGYLNPNNNAFILISDLAATLTREQVLVIPQNLVQDKTIAVIVHKDNCWSIATYKYEADPVTPVQATDMRIQPNPSRGSFDLWLQADYEGEVHISIADMAGRVLYRQSAQKTSGAMVQGIQAPLPSGMYLLQAVFGNEQKVLKLLLH